MIVFKKGEQVVLNPLDPQYDSWKGFLSRYKVPLDFIFTIYSDSRTDLAKNYGGMSYIEIPNNANRSLYLDHVDKYWSIHTNSIKYHHVIVDLDEDDSDCI